MKKLEEAINYLKSGSVLIIDKQNLAANESCYNGTVILYDGKIFKDVLGFELGKFLSLIPNIKAQLDLGYKYHITYIPEQKNYQSSIIKPIEYEQYKTLPSNCILDEFQVFNESVLDSMIDLDTKLAEEIAKRKSLKYKIQNKILKLIS